MIKSVKVNKTHFMAGLSWKSFSLGFTIDRFGVTLSLGFLWLAVEL
jgi:hypothetical protein